MNSMFETGEHVKVKDFYTQKILPGIFEIDHVEIKFYYDDEIRTYRVKNIETGELIEGLCWREIESL
jgi:hypothetical protein